MKKLTKFIFLMLFSLFMGRQTAFCHSLKSDPLIHDFRSIKPANCSNLTQKDYTKLSNQQFDALQQSVCEVSSTLPADSQSLFNAFDYALYAETVFLDEANGQDFVFQSMVAKAEAASQYYILIAKQHTKNSINVNYKIKIKIPLGGCINSENIGALEGIVSDSMNACYAQKGTDPHFTIEAEISGLIKLKNLLTTLYQNGSCCLLYSNENVASQLRDLGGKELKEEIKVTQISGWSPPSNNNAQLLDYAGLSLRVVTTQGQTIQISNFATSLLSKVNEVIITDPSALKIVVTKGEVDDCMDNFQTLKQVYNSADFAIWVHFDIVDFSTGECKIILCGKAPPSGFENTGPFENFVNDESEDDPPLAKENRVSTLPILYWLAKGFTSAIIDAAVQFFVNYDGDAFSTLQKISWAGVAWEGLYGCLPWSANKFGDAALSAVGTVIVEFAAGRYNGNDENNVWYKVAMDFGRSFIINLGVNKVADYLMPRLQKYLIKCNGFCFANDTKVWTPGGLISIEMLEPVKPTRYNNYPNNFENK